MDTNVLPPIIPTIGIIVFREDEVLLVRHGSNAGHLKDSLGIPAGRINLNNEFTPLETAKAAAVRELKEETGYHVDEVDLQPFTGNHFTADVPRSDGTTKRMSWDVFIAQKISGEMRQSNDETTPVWYKIEELDSLTLIVNVKNAIDNALKFLQENQ
nr:NUDIX domain protein [uncultured bacterium]